jgi:hypothetical protein
MQRLHTYSSAADGELRISRKLFQGYELTVNDCLKAR